MKTTPSLIHTINLYFSAAAISLLSLTSCKKGGSGGNPDAKTTASSSLGNEAPISKSDELASHPEDPDRMAAGVTMEKIVPRLALQACEESVSEYPKSARFHYQMGRALIASGRKQDAIKSFEKASAMGYRMANFNLGKAYAEGDGVAVDLAKGEMYFKKAADAGVQPAVEALAQFTFSSADFSNPEFFQAIYDGDFKSLQADPTGLATYVSTFVDSFAGTPGCGQVLSNQAMASIRGHVTAKVFGMFLGGAAGARHDHAPGDFAGAAGAGARAGDQLSRRLGAMIDKGKADAQLFYDRYSCDTPVANRFFNNLDTFSKMLGSPNFMKELEKHVK